MSPADIVHTRVGTKEAGSEGDTEGGRMVEEGNECCMASGCSTYTHNTLH